ncbi:hypothetical protein NGUA18_04192 [Salmonella enterica]|nr:hypothetical protein NGUA18_04192 [Salmonella enterica]
MPQFNRRWEFVERNFPLNRAGCGFIVEDKAIAIGSEDERNVQQVRITQRLLHPFADFILIGFGLNHRQRHV